MRQSRLDTTASVDGPDTFTGPVFLSAYGLDVGNLVFDSQLILAGVCEYEIVDWDDWRERGLA